MSPPNSETFDKRNVNIVTDEMDETSWKILWKIALTFINKLVFFESVFNSLHDFYVEEMCRSNLIVCIYRPINIIEYRLKVLATSLNVHAATDQVEKDNRQYENIWTG